MKGFRFSHDAEGVFGDLDALGHVNNVVYLKWIETARIAYWIHVTGQKAHTGLPSAGGASHEPGPGIMSGVLIDMILAIPVDGEIDRELVKDLVRARLAELDKE